jgi:hypothetical protein
MNALPDSIPARGAAASTSRPSRIGQLLRQSFTAMTAQERARLVAMYGVIAGLHVAGFVILFAFVVPSHYKGLGVGVAVLAYTLGVRHAFDADHISAIDNCTRKVLGERQGTEAPRPLGFGFFSLGHSTVVVAIGAGIVVAEKTVFGAVSDNASGLERFGTVRHSRFGGILAADRATEPGGPGRDREGLRLDAPRRVRRGRARAPTRVPRADESRPRAIHPADPRAVAHVPDWAPLRPRL